jgi:outer membrane protein assembly factor BamB
MWKLLLAVFLVNTVSAQLPHGNQWPVTGKDYEMTYVNDRVRSHTFDTANTIAISWDFFPAPVAGAIWEASFDAHPAIAYGSVYAADTLGRLYSFDLETGSQNWNITLSTNFSDRGKVERFQTTPVVTEDYVLVSYRNIYSVDRLTGSVIWSSSLTGDDTSVGPDGRLTSYYAYSGDITVVDELAIVGVASTQNEITTDMLLNPNNTDLTAQGSVACFNLYNGHLVWRFNTTSDQTVSHPQYGAGASAWSSPSIDRSRHTVYIGTGQSFEPPASPYTDSILAIDYHTGTLLWSYQGKHNDVYNSYTLNTMGDRDMATHPNLFTVSAKLPGTRHIDDYDLVGIGSKDGNYYILNRDQTSVNGTVLVILPIDFGSTLGGIQSTPVYKDEMLYIASHAVIDPVTGIRRSYNASIPTDIDDFSSRVTAVDVVAAVENRTYVVWMYQEDPGFFRMSFGPLSNTRDILFHPSFAGYIDIFRLSDGSKSSTTLVTELPVSGAVTIAQDHFCTGVGVTFLGVNVPGGIICYV